MLYLAVFLGAILYVGFQLNGVYAKDDFSWKVFFKTNVIPSSLNLVIGLVLVLIKDDLVNIYPMTMLTAVFLGFAGQAIFKKLQNTFDSDKKTFIGI